MLKGIAVSEGIAQGIAFCIDADRNKENCEDSYRKAESQDEESARFQEAMTTFLEETERAACDLEKRGMSEEAGILRSHMEMIKDPSVTSKIKGSTSQPLHNSRVFFNFSSLLALAYTFIPSSASLHTIACPIPPAAPVTSAIFFMLSSYLIKFVQIDFSRFTGFSPFSMHFRSHAMFSPKVSMVCKPSSSRKTSSGVFP